MRFRLDPLSPTGVSIAPEATVVKQSNGFVTNNIRGLISAGSNVTIAGNGTESSPYEIAAGDMDVAATWGNVTGTLSDQTDLQTALDGKSGTAHTHLLAAGATDVTATATELNTLDGITATTTELNYTDGVTSAIQTQLNGKLNLSGGTLTGDLLFTNTNTFRLSNDTNSLLFKRFGTTVMSYTSDGVADQMKIDSTGMVLKNTHPLANNTYSNGSPTLYWSNIYATRHYLNSTAYIDGTTAGKIDLSGNQTTSGYLRVGSSTAPVATTAGSLTVDNYLVVGGNASPSAAGWISRIAGSITTTSAGAQQGIAFSPAMNPSGASSSQYRAVYVSATTQSGNDNTYNQITGLHLETRMQGGGNVTELRAAEMLNFINGANFTSANGSTVSNAFGLKITPITTTAHSPTGTITDAYGLSITNSTVGAGPITITNQIGVNVQNLTSGATNIGVRIAKADTYSLQLSDTGGTAAGGITFGTDTTLYRSAADTLKTDDTFNAAAYQVNGTAGASGTFTTVDSKTVTVTNGLITSIV